MLNLDNLLISCASFMESALSLLLSLLESLVSGARPASSRCRFSSSRLAFFSSCFFFLRTAARATSAIDVDWLDGSDLICRIEVVRVMSAAPAVPVRLPARQEDELRAGRQEDVLIPSELFMGVAPRSEDWSRELMVPLETACPRDIICPRESALGEAVGLASAPATPPSVLVDG
mmetsp:Transcript_89232/g.158203  ORF Transcript_89232/g.158203 Transcript_89232/m.158203 type:complete len:175 (-) Transcript_89232:158-682(-)